MHTEDGGVPGADAPTEARPEPWRDPSLPVPTRVDSLLNAMNLEEKVAQLYAVWVGVDPDSQDVAPHQHELADTSVEFAELVRSGLGQLTRPLGTAPVAPAEGVKILARLQQDVVAANRFGIPALVHEECLTGFMTRGATIYPTPLAWGATFDPVLVERMAAQIGDAIRAVGGHQGLAPVLDVTLDARWGRTEETIGEDPYLVGTIGTAHVIGLQSTGVVATLKHFAGYSASNAARNLAPVAVGPRQMADLLLLPFEMAVRNGGAKSVMSAYTETDGVPVAADRTLLTDLLRDTWGFAGTVVADYFGVSFLETLHRVAAAAGEAGVLAVTSGVDVELPSVRCYGPPLLDAVRSGVVAEEVIDRAAERVLRQKCELGLLDPDWSALPPALRDTSRHRGVDLDPPAARETARRLAEESVVLLANGGALPLRGTSRIAIVGPNADDAYAMFGCYAFPSHVDGASRPVGAGLGVEVRTVLQSLRDELGGTEIEHVAGCDVTGDDTAGFRAAVDAARQADVCVAVLGDRAGLFGRGTSGEGCDVEDLRLPGVQGELLDELIGSGTPVVLVLLTGRPYALGAYADRLAAAVQAFFPGEEGASAVAGVLSGRVCPSGRLPVGVPARPTGDPATYLAPPLGRRSEVSVVDPTPLYPFGHGLSYTTFSWTDPAVDGEPVGAELARMRSDGEITVSLSVRNDGDRAGADVVQLYLHDPVAQTTRPVVRLVGYARVQLEPGEQRRVTFRMHADLTAFTGVRGHRIVEPGQIELRVARSAVDTVFAVPVIVEGPERTVDHTRRLTSEAGVEAHPTTVTG